MSRNETRTDHTAPAEPHSPQQEKRYQRIVAVAEDQIRRFGAEGVQMQEIANESEVAIGTLYRYFPSKAQLFTAVLRALVDQHATRVEPPGDFSAEESLVRALNNIAGDLLAKPRLSLAVLQANVVSLAHQSSEQSVHHHFVDLMAVACGWEEPTELETRILWIIQQAWYGMVFSCLNGYSTRQDLYADTGLLCRSMLAECDTTDASEDDSGDGRSAP